MRETVQPSMVTLSDPQLQCGCSVHETSVRTDFIMTRAVVSGLRRCAQVTLCDQTKRKQSHLHVVQTHATHTHTHTHTHKEGRNAHARTHTLTPHTRTSAAGIMSCSSMHGWTDMPTSAGENVCVCGCWCLCVQVCPRRVKSGFTLGKSHPQICGVRAGEAVGQVSDWHAYSKRSCCCCCCC